MPGGIVYTGLACNDHTKGCNKACEANWPAGGFSSMAVTRLHGEFLYSEVVGVLHQVHNRTKLVLQDQRVPGV